MSSTTSRRVGPWRRVLVCAVGAGFGLTLLSPVAAQVADGRPAPAATHTRTSSCIGYNFHTIDSDTAYDYSGTLVYRPVEGGPDGSGYFVCDPGLPNGAVVTRVRFTLFDGTPDLDIPCSLARGNLSASSAGQFKVLAAVETAGQPRKVRLSTSQIVFGTIDNTRFGYWLQCQLVYNNGGAGIYGADVTYRIGGANA